MTWLPLLLLSGCKTLEELPKDQPCLEAGYAIARRTFECTGDGDLANARFERFRREYRCVPLGDFFVDTGQVTKYLQTSDSGISQVFPPDTWHCALAIDGLPCETVDAYGNDIDQWMSVSEACGWIARPKGAR